MTLPNAPYRKPEVLGLGHVAERHGFTGEVPHAGRAGSNAFGGIVATPEEGELGGVAVGFVVETVAGGHGRELESENPAQRNPHGGIDHQQLRLGEGVGLPVSVEGQKDVGQVLATRNGANEDEKRLSVAIAESRLLFLLFIARTIEIVSPIIYNINLLGINIVCVYNVLFGVF